MLWFDHRDKVKIISGGDLIIEIWSQQNGDFARVILSVGRSPQSKNLRRFRRYRSRCFASPSGFDFAQDDR